MSVSANKKRLITLIHVAKSKLNMSDEAYRAVLLDIGGKESSKDLGVIKLEAVLEHMKSCGFKPKRGKNSGTVKGKLRALWSAMAKEGIVKDGSTQALNAYVKNNTTVDRVEWLTNKDAGRLVEMLKQWRKRVEREANADNVS